MKAVINATDTIASFLVKVAGVALIGMILILVTNILLRWLGSPLVGTYELISMSAIVVFGLSLAQAQVDKSNVAIDLVVSRLRKRTQLVVGVVVTLLSIFIVTTLAIALWRYGVNLLGAGSTTEALEIPSWPQVFIVFSGVTVLVLVLFADLARLRQSARSASLEIDIW